MAEPYTDMEILTLYVAFQQEQANLEFVPFGQTEFERWPLDRRVVLFRQWLHFLQTHRPPSGGMYSLQAELDEYRRQMEEED